MDVPRLKITSYGNKVDPDGGYVDYIEHARLVAKLEAERDRLRGLLREFVPNQGCACFDDDDDHPGREESACQWHKIGLLDFVRRINAALEARDG